MVTFSQWPYAMDATSEEIDTLTNG